MRAQIAAIRELNATLDGITLLAGTEVDILADGRMYVTSEEGVTAVFSAGPKFELLAENVVDEFTLSSVAISQGQIFLRTDKHLYAIGSINRSRGERR